MHDVKCPHCAKRMSAAPAMIGARVACRHCGRGLVVPSPTPQPFSVSATASASPPPKPLHWTKPIALGVTILYVASVGLSFLWVFFVAGSNLQERQAADPELQGARTVGTFVG